MDEMVFGVFDSKAEAYVHHFMASTRGIAIRSFAAAACDSQHEYHRFGADYTLFELGSFDRSTGRHKDHDQPINLGHALSYTGGSTSEEAEE